MHLSGMVHCESAPERLPELKPLDFARGRLGQTLYDYDPTRPLERRHLIPAVPDQHCRVRSVPGRGDHECRDTFEPLLVAVAAHPDLQNRLVSDEHALILSRRHPYPTCLDHVVVTPEERPMLIG